MILLFTDFGLAGPFVGQMRAVLARLAPEIPAIDLMHDAPAFRPDLAAPLLAALLAESAPGDVVLAVVDPGVGSARAPLAIQADRRWLVGPDNGLFALATRRARISSTFAIAWRPPVLSASFHGRDLFAPVAAALACGREVALTPHRTEIGEDWPDDLARIVHIDHYGNAATGLRAAGLPPACVLLAGGRRFTSARTFSDRAPGTGFWYANANGLAEIAISCGHAADQFGLELGSRVEIDC